MRAVTRELHLFCCNAAGFGLRRYTTPGAKRTLSPELKPVVVLLIIDVEQDSHIFNLHIHYSF
jgi:hypothetical protein